MIPVEFNQVFTLLDTIRDTAKAVAVKPRHTKEVERIADLTGICRDLVEYLFARFDEVASDSSPRAVVENMPQAVLDAGYAAALAWWADLCTRLEQHEKDTGLSGYGVDNRLREHFNALPAGQHGAFLDAVGAYLMIYRIIGQPSETFLMSTDRLRMYTLSPAEQDAWAEKECPDE